MLSTNSCFKAILRENLTKYWAVPVLSLIGLLLVGLLPMLLNYRNFQLVSSYAASIAKGGSFTIIAVIMITSVVASAAVFGYLHDPVSSNAIHSMPLKRSDLFGASFVSGWLMIVVPIIVFPFFMMIIRGAEFNKSIDEEWAEMFDPFGNGIMQANEIFTMSHMLGFIVTSIVIATFFYAVACFSAVLSGRTIIHVLLAFFLTVLPSTLVFETEVICSAYLFGFSGFDINGRLLGAGTFAAGKETFALEASYLLYYIVLAALVVILSIFVYKRIKLERVGNATTFPVVGDMLAALLSVMCTLGFAHLLAWIGSGGLSANAVRFAAIAVISSAAFYIVMRMIADSSFAIFNPKNLTKYGICLAVIAVILAFTAFDISGYGKRIPDASSVKSIHVTTDFPQGNMDIDKSFDDAATIEDYIDLQQAAFDERNVDSSESYQTDTFELSYELKDGRTIKRTIETNAVKGHEKTRSALKKIYDSESFKTLDYIDVVSMVKRCKNVSFMAYGDQGEAMDMEDYKSVKREDWEGLFEAMNKDLSAPSFEDVYETKDGDSADVEFEDFLDIEVEYDKAVGAYEVQGKTYSIDTKDSQTFEFLKARGYFK